jgi:hypothetical protein
VKIAQLDKTIGKDGKERPAKRPGNKPPASVEEAMAAPRFKEPRPDFNHAAGS